MPVDASAVDPIHLSKVISQATAPAFLLGAVSGFLAVLVGRMNGVIDRVRSVNAIPDADPDRSHLRSDLPRLMRRAKLMNEAIFLAVGSAICTTLLVIWAFVSAFLGLRHEPGAAVLFVLALALLCASPVALALEVRIALSEHEHYG